MPSCSSDCCLLRRKDVKVFSEDGTCKVVEILADMTARDLCQLLVYKSHCVDDDSWTLVEHHPLLGLEEEEEEALSSLLLHGPFLEQSGSYSSLNSSGTLGTDCTHRFPGFHTTTGLPCWIVHVLQVKVASVLENEILKPSPRKMPTPQYSLSLKKLAVVHMESSHVPWGQSAAKIPLHL
ncbi:hypothetical protein JD844_002547 [Phrynosoma platyrhinos]|uniref:Ras-associating domain-containing protein n=1 Tax=Phrynosoma platyrhinos TaxID=52577 RepID=A0ABQ7TCA9_PHRPL|nr:hypothetical protein JD844_002547 [Phrynosoma platyrhinos]